MKNDLEKLHDQKLPDDEDDDADDDDNEESENENNEKKSVKNKQKRKDDEETAEISETEEDENLTKDGSNLYLIKEYTDVYKSIKIERFPTSLVINRNLSNNMNGFIEESNEREQLQAESRMSENEKRMVNDMATVLVKSIIEKAVSEVQSHNPENIPDCYDSAYIERAYLTDKTISKPNASQSSILNDFNANKSNSRLSYYKDFQTDIDVVMKEFERGGAMIDGKNDENEKLVIEFEDEPLEYVENLFFLV